jgi:CDP-diacylglycerol--glycerol-3-phosphate 3-phosphatidyltransferase
MNSSAVLSLVPLFVVNGIFLIGLAIFTFRVLRSGLPAPTAVSKQHRGMIGRFLQQYLMWMIGPVERALVRSHISPNQLTAGSLLLSSAAAVVLAIGYFGLGGWLYLFNGIVDIFDGRVARATGRVSSSGAFADSVADRVSEAAVFSGLAWYYRHTPVLLLVMAGLFSSFLISYTRARGEGLGVTGGDVGRMQRPERIFFLGITLSLSPVLAALVPAQAEMYWAGVGGLTLVSVASLGTAIGRFRYVYRALAEQQASSAVPVVSLRPVRLSSTNGKGSTEEDGASLASAGPN